MSKLGLVILIVLIAGRINAQDYPDPTSDPPTYFVLIQADSGQAFYIRLDSQLYSSSQAGHLILSQLKDSVYTITVGFPGQIYPEQRYLLNILQRDWSLHLSRQDNRWSLMDDQGQAMPAVADPAAAEMPLLAGAKKDDAFSQMMAAIVRDTAVMYNTYATTSDSTQTSVRTDTAAPIAAAKPGSPADTVTGTSQSVTPAQQTTVSPSNSSFTSIPSSSAIPSSPTGVVKLSEHKSTQSLSLVYTDHPVDKKTDTIDVVIPVDTQAVAVGQTTNVQIRDTAQANNSAASTIHIDDFVHTDRIRKLYSDTPRSGSPLSETPRSGSPFPGHASRSDTPALASAASHKSNLPFINSDCHSFATDYDVDKLRVRMLDANKDDDRIQVAYKIFKTKCFSTSQVSALSEVFTTDAAKFKFLEAAYPFVSDDRFPELVRLLSDPVYAGKFRTMTGRH
jgi:Domain of unknown function (DUF4476)